MAARVEGCLLTSWQRKEKDSLPWKVLLGSKPQSSLPNQLPFIHKTWPIMLLKTALSVKDQAFKTLNLWETHHTRTQGCETREQDCGGMTGYVLLFLSPCAFFFPNNFFQTLFQKPYPTPFAKMSILCLLTHILPQSISDQMKGNSVRDYSRLSETNTLLPKSQSCEPGLYKYRNALIRFSMRIHHLCSVFSLIKISPSMYQFQALSFTLLRIL